jgi:hypothetical protein
VFDGCIDLRGRRVWVSAMGGWMVFDCWVLGMVVEVEMDGGGGGRDKQEEGVMLNFQINHLMISPICDMA